jgi:hypothetical protein
MIPRPWHCHDQSKGMIELNEFGRHKISQNRNVTVSISSTEIKNISCRTHSQVIIAVSSELSRLFTRSQIVICLLVIGKAESHSPRRDFTAVETEITSGNLTCAFLFVPTDAILMPMEQPRWVPWRTYFVGGRIGASAGRAPSDSTTRGGQVTAYGGDHTADTMTLIVVHYWFGDLTTKI